MSLESVATGLGGLARVQAGGLPRLAEECFFIAPIGVEKSDERERSDGVLEFVVGPAAQAVGLVAVRADRISRPGRITQQIFEHVMAARASVVDLTGANPNVYYEMAVRHTLRMPTVLVAQQGERLPSDIAHMRTIFFDHTNLRSAMECRGRVSEYLREALDGAVDSSIAAPMDIHEPQRETEQERILGQIRLRSEPRRYPCFKARRDSFGRMCGRARSR